ncbi:hypothetical protein RB653_007273 [Dictyostelium firmibasis]|uniref:NUC153 domain-containing protein n=1 Tax=Dictyostelium firmibasis TaxID=79012 RepID=A0AAN7TU97_9MYCE
MKSNKPKQSSGGGSGKPYNSAITDTRFTHAQNDPKFKMYRRKDNAIALDNRFGDLMKSNSSFTSNAPIDEYGRKIEKNKIDKSIKKTYVLEETSNQLNKDKKVEQPKTSTKKEIDNKKKVVETKTKNDNKNNKKKANIVVSESESESEPEPESEIEDESINSDIESEKVIEYGGFEYNSDTESSDAEEFQGDDVEEEGEEEEEVPRGDATKRFAVLNCDWDNVTSKQLFILLNSFVPSGGHIERITIYPSDFGLEQMAREKSLGPNKEIWDSTNIITNNGLKESSISFDRQEDAESLDGKGFNLEKLRQYELSKLKYYYAVVECNSINTANKIYDECEGMEIEDTANVLDLRFIPDDQKFKNTPRDTCTELPATASDENGGFGFQTSILKGTTVDFTWDIDKTRKKLLTKNFSKFDAREEDLRAYLADPTSSEESDDDDDDEDGHQNNFNDNDKNSKRLALRNKYKSLLLDGIEDEEEKDDIQITFNSAFSDSLKQQKTSDDESEDDDDGLSIKFSDQEINTSSEEESDKEATINDESDSADDESSENEGNEDDESSENEGDEDDDNLLNGSDSEAPDWANDLKSDSEDDTVQEMVINTDLNNVGKKLLKEKAKRENGNVFTEYLDKKKEKKAQKKREKRVEIEKLIKEKEEKEKQQKKNKSKGRMTEEEKKEKAELELLLMDDDLSKNKGYTKKQLEREAKMNTIDPIERKKLEKKLKKKNQKMEVKDDKHLIDLQGFKIDTKDERFINIYTSKYDIDPTDPKFKRTSGMVEFLSEKKNRRQVEKEKEEKEILERRKNLKEQQKNNNENDNSTTTTSKSILSEMAQNIKRKAEEQKNKENSKKFKK